MRKPTFYAALPLASTPTKWMSTQLLRGSVVPRRHLQPAAKSTRNVKYSLQFWTLRLPTALALWKRFVSDTSCVHWTDKTHVSLNFLLGANIKMLDSFHIIHTRIHSSELLHVTIHKQKQMIRNKSRVCRWPTHTANFTPWKCCQVKKSDISTYSACLALARRRTKQSAPQTQRKVSKL